MEHLCFEDRASILFKCFFLERKLWDCTAVAVVNAEQNHSLDRCLALVAGILRIAIVRSGSCLFGPGLSLFNHTASQLIVVIAIQYSLEQN